MGLKEMLRGKIDKDQAYPDDFEPSKEAEKVISNVDEDITSFLKRKGKELKEKPVRLPVKEKLESLDLDSPKEEVEEEEIEEKQEEIEESKEETPMSNLSQILTIYVEEKNIEKSKEAIRDSIKEGYAVGLQAGIQVNSKNVEKVNSVINYLVKNKYLVVVSADKVDSVF